MPRNRCRAFFQSSLINVEINPDVEIEIFKALLTVSISHFTATNDDNKIIIIIIIRASGFVILRFFPNDYYNINVIKI